ncbi:MAG TPA: Rnase Y domain-containing protein, partial [Anaerolineaceae bacterium]|nr:Rnase Y domain-containing protein [Anaerolineaceae bacterium]
MRIPPEVIIFSLLGALIVAAILAYVLVRVFTKRFKKEQTEKADNLLQVAGEKARTLELEARDKALKVLQDSESEIARRRQDILREDDRLQKRRAEMDARIEKLEIREQNLNKRQSALDKRSNDIEKLYSDQMEELQRIAQLSTQEAKQILLDETEKEARGDMARIIRQIEAEARVEGD